MTNNNPDTSHQNHDSLQKRLYTASKQFSFTFLTNERTASTRQAIMFAPTHLLGPVQDHLSGEQALDLHLEHGSSNGKTTTGVITLHATTKEQLNASLTALTLRATLADVPAYYERRDDNIRIFIFLNGELPLADMNRHLNGWITWADLPPEVDAYINEKESPLPYLGASSCPEGLGATYLQQAETNQQIPVHELYGHIRHANPHALTAFNPA